MPQRSKLTRSRDEWRTKAVLRATENREYKKADKRNKEQLIALKKQNEELRLIVDDLKKTTDYSTIVCC